MNGSKRDAGLAYALWWLAAALLLPIADVVLLVGLHALGLLLGSAIGWLIGLTAAVALNIGLLRWWGLRLRVPGVVIGAAVAVSLVAAVFAFVIFAVAVIAPGVA